MVEAIAYASAGDRAIVDDVVQDTFVSAWQQLDRLRDPARLRPWLCGIAMNVARKARRRRRREVALVDVSGGDTPFEAAAEHERALEVTTALATLSPRYRDPLVLFYYEQCSVKEVAATLAIREDAAMQRLSRGRQQLGDVLAARVEEALERKPSRKAIAVAVIALLPLVRARSSLAAVAQKLVAVSVRGSTATLRVIAARWRPVAALVATAVIGVIFVRGVRTSERIAAAHAAHDYHAPAPAAPMTEDPVASKRDAHAPQLPDDDDGRTYANISVASTDPIETCRRGVHGLISFVLDPNSIVVENGQTYYRPDPTVERMAYEVADKVAETCGTPWPELYVKCEGTMKNILDGIVTCYPYDGFD
jgi:RNA polymerase sigma factor (sigma-70 family)